MIKSTLKILAIFVFLSLVACGKEERTSLNVEERKIVNTRYKEALDSINKLMIAECTDLRKKKFDLLVDSIKTMRIEEIELITKVKSNEQ